MFRFCRGRDSITHAGHLSFPWRGELSGGWLVNLFDQRAWGMHPARILGKDSPVAPPAVFGAAAEWIITTTFSAAVQSPCRPSFVRIDGDLNIGIQPHRRMARYLTVRLASFI